jgi:hypothetical protein
VSVDDRQIGIVAVVLVAITAIGAYIIIGLL